ncbi:MAG: FAD-binding oxidoreductase [Methanosarcinaceae archaeon]|nr:FAD-binding oxidoreductase [Methanosarcinaceae archaeon]
MTKYVSELSEKQKEELTNIFGNKRVNFSKRERHYYTHDVGTLPYLVKPMLGKVEPAAIVKVSSEDEAVKLIKFANKHEIPIVPRAGASSGYGGVIATKGGVIADVTTMNKVIEIDKKNLTATVGAGIVWELLENKLEREGLALRAVPSSAPSSTPGGWLAQAGIGYGSYEYGWSYETMESARIVLPTGEVKEITGSDFDKISGTMGTTGIITQIKLKLRKYEKTIATSAEFPDATSMKNAIKAVSDKKIPLWAISLLNPNFADMKNKAPPATHHGHPVDEHRPILPKAYIINFAYPESRDVSELKSVIEQAGGKVLSDEIAQHETNEWYKSMKVKRLGPSFVPAEVLVPVDKVDKVIDEIQSKISLPVLMEGMVTNDNMVTLLCFIPHSELSIKFNLAFPLALSIVKIAEKNGGRLYSSGLYFAKQANKVYGDRFAVINEFKAKNDPKGIMNPETLTGKSLLKTGLSFAQTFEPITRLVGNMSGVKQSVKFKDQKGIPGDIISHAYTCAQCGYCVSECDQYYGRGWESQSSRGKWFFMKEFLAGREELDQEQTNTFLACTTCETCVSKCQLDLPIEPDWLRMRNILVGDKGKMTFPPFEIMAASLIKERNIWATYQTERDKWVPEDLKPKIKDKADHAYFAGCTASLVEKDIATSTARILDEAGVEFTYMGNEEACCGIPMLASGKWDVFEGIMRLNVENMKKREAKTVITSCPACWLVWNHFYREWAVKLGIDYDFEVKHYSEVVAERLDVLAPKFKVPLNKVVTWHDSCHAGRAGGLYEPPRDLIKAIPGVEFRELEHNRERAHCCGSVLSLLDDPEVANVIGAVKLNEAMDVDAEMLLALCPCCQVQLRVTADRSNIPIDVQDLGTVVARSLGYDIPDSTGVALESWAIFEKMIYLLKPENMTDLMVELLPEMMDAMPSYLKLMMKTVKYVPGMDILMKPMMPKMMPLLMPMLMPKVMPAMLDAVGRRIPMPDYMSEQMPDLMPTAMDNLLPNMLPQIAPLLTPKMIEYIKNN